MDVLGAMSAVEATRRHVTSAQPGAPERRPRPARAVAAEPGRVRVGTAGVLRRLADRLDRPVRAGEVSCG